MEFVNSFFLQLIQVNDPPPDILEYQYPRDIKEKCYESENGLKKCQSNAPNAMNCSEFINGTLHKKSEVWQEDNFLITLNSPHNFLMNTAVSVTVDFKACLPSRVGIDTSGRSGSYLKSKELSRKTLECVQSMKMSKSYPQCTFSSQNELSQSFLSGAQWSPLRSPKAGNKSTSHPRSSPSQKRVLSPRDMVSPSKRKKLSPPQKNKIFRYLIRTNEINEGKVNVGTQSEMVGDVKHSNLFRNCPVEKIGGNFSHERKDIPEVIAISSDEEDDRGVSTQKSDLGKVREQAYKNAAVICDSKSVSAKNFSSDISNYSRSKGSVCVNRMNNFNKQDNEDDGCIVISHEEEPCIPAAVYETIDLTCDDVDDLDDAGGAIKPETDDFKNYSVAENDICEHGDSFKQGIFFDERKERNEETDLGKIIGLSSPSYFEEVETSSVVPCSEVTPLRKSSKLKSRQERNNIPYSFAEQLSQHGIEENTTNFDSNIDADCVEHLKSYENVQNKCLDLQAISDLSLSSSLHIFDKSVEKYDGLKEEWYQDESPKISDNYGESIVKTKCVFSEHEKKQRSSSQDNTEDRSATTLPSDVPANGWNVHSGELLPKCVNSENQLDKMILEIQDDGESSESGESLSSTFGPNAVDVCQVQAEVLLNKLYEPWTDLGCEYVPKCCLSGLTACHTLRGRKEDFPEELDYYDENLVLRTDSGISAMELLQSRLDSSEFPSYTIVQYALLSCVDLWTEGVTDVLYWLHELLDEYPPCAYGMLEYYKKVFFNPVLKLGAPDGIFWCIVLKIDDIMMAVEKMNTRKTSTEEVQNPYDFLTHILETAITLSPEKDHEEQEQHSCRLKKLFSILDFVINVMEADLSVGLLKNVSNQNRYVYKSGRPLVASALWGTRSNVGTVNENCKLLMKMYFRLFESYRETRYHHSFRRLISLMAGVTYASDRNSELPRYPNIESNCMEFASTFTSLMMNTALNMAQVPAVLEDLRPDWLRVCVCSSLLEKLYGRSMEVSLKPFVTLFEHLGALKEDFPSEEELSNTLLAEANNDNNNVSIQDLEMSPNFLKNALRKDKKGETRLHIACRRNNVSEVEKLLNVPEISVNEKDNYGWTPLHEAACHGNVNCVRKLLNYRTPSGCPAVDLRAKSKQEQRTPLMDAVLQNHLQVALELLQFGGKELLSDTNVFGQSACDLADTQEMKRILQNAPQYSMTNYLLSIPRTLYIKLAVLTPLAIIFYIKFSEIIEIINSLKINTGLTRNEASFFKFQPITFRQDYVELKKLKSYIKEAFNTQNKLVDTLSFLV